MGGLDCSAITRTETMSLTGLPIDIEFLLTMNETSLLETESPQHQVVIEVSPVHILLSENRLALLSSAQKSIDMAPFTDASKLNSARKPDPPRIEILSGRILHTVDVSCRRAQVALVKDTGKEDGLGRKFKEVVMEECLSDFLSVVSCFDFSLPNEEALSSSMQVCIGRLVGLGLTDDEAWGCTNAARHNFLDAIALMRRASTDALVQFSSSVGNDSSLFTETVAEEIVEDGNSERSSDSFAFVEESLADSSNQGDADKSDSDTETTDAISDDDSANSADIVETTMNNAVEKTVATFAPLLQQFHAESKNMHSILTFDLPMGLRWSMVKLFYDQHIALLLTSLMVTNSAGIELLTLVPYVEDSRSVTSEESSEVHRRGISMSRFLLDKGHDFGSGGLAMSVLGSDDGDQVGFFVRDRERFDDVDIGEIELLFSSRLYEEVVDEISKFRSDKGEPNERKQEDVKSGAPSKLDTSLVLMATSVSVLFTSDELVPFSRLTLEKMTYKNSRALQAISSLNDDVPSWDLVAKSMSLQNLTPEGQFYPDVLSLLPAQCSSVNFPFQIRYFRSPDPWQFSNRLQIEVWRWQTEKEVFKGCS